MTRPVVYISGPITKGDRNNNVHQAYKAHAWLMLAGYAPINPMASCQYPFAWAPEYTHDLWLECDLPIIERCDAVLRLPGESSGADRETEHATTLGIPVFTSRETLDEWRETQWA